MEKAFNFDINEKYIQPTADNIGHELPYFYMPDWENLDKQYRNAAKGFSQELQHLKAVRLCSYLNFYARPSRKSVVILHADKNKRLKDIHSGVNGEPIVVDKDIYFELTGLFVDMPDGRFHYVKLDNVYNFNTLDIWSRYHHRRDYNYTNIEGRFRYAFVREDLIKIITQEKNVETTTTIRIYPLEFKNSDQKEIVKELGIIPPPPMGVRNEINHKWKYSLYDFSPEYRDIIKQSFKEKGYYEVKHKKEREIIEILPLVSYKPIKYEIKPPSSPERVYSPEYYNYRYIYYEYPEMGLSYLYMMLPRYYYKSDFNPEFTELAYDWTINRVTSYRNNGNTEMLNETNVEPDTKETTDTNKILKYTALTAGAILLGRAING